MIISLIGQFAYCYMYISWLTKFTRQVSLMEQELLTFLEYHLIHSFRIFKLFYESESSKNKNTTILKKN